jgi:hypothetical protein
MRPIVLCAILAPVVLTVAVGPCAYADAPAPGAALGDEFQIAQDSDGPLAFPHIATDPVGNFVLVWENDGGLNGDSDVFGQRYSSDGAKAGKQFQVNSYTVYNQIGPAIAMDAAGDFVVTWSSKHQDGNGFGIFAQRYAADGSPRGSEFQVNVTTLGDQVHPAIAMDAAGDFVVAWLDTSNFHRIVARRYDKNGDSMSGEIDVSTATKNTKNLGVLNPRVAMDAAGDFIVAWTLSKGVGAETYRNIRVRQFDADGAASKPFQANTADIDAASAPSIAMDATGDFVLIWDGEKDGNVDVVAQRYTADGTPAGKAFRANATIDGYQGAVSGQAVAMDAAGEFTVVWTSNYQNRDGSGVYARRYSADGEPADDEFQISTPLPADACPYPPCHAGDQGNGAIAMDAAGSFTVVWEGGQVFKPGLFGRRYASGSSIDLKSSLAVAPDDSIKAGGGISLTASIGNAEKSVNFTGMSEIDSALETATGLTATLTFPDGTNFDKATGTHWQCTSKLSKHKLICTYSAPLKPSSETTNLLVNATVGKQASGKFTFKSAAFGDQPDAETDNNTDQASVTVESSASDDGDTDTSNRNTPSPSSGGGGGSFGWLGLGLGLIGWRLRRDRSALSFGSHR